MTTSHTRWAGLILILIGYLIASYGLPVQAATVVPQPYTDNPGCAGNSGGTRNLGYTFGITITPPSNGSFRFTPSTDVALTGPIDNDETLRLNNAQNTSFDWTSTLRMDAVIVRSAGGANVYVYEGESGGDNTLVTLDGTNISSIEFCYDYELDFSATATGTFVTGEQWTLSRIVEPELVQGFIGDIVNTRYTVSATKEIAQFNYDARGQVTIINPSPYSVDLILNVQNIGQRTTVTCTSATTSANYVTIPGNTTANCEYRSDIFVDRSILGYWSLNPYVSPTGEGNAVIVPVPIEWSSTEAQEGNRINDTMFGTLGTPDEPAGTYEFDVDVQCPTDPAEYSDGIYRAVQLSRAVIGRGEQELSAANSVQITCYAPMVTNRAVATFNTRQSWEIARTVSPEAQAAFAGETVDLVWVTELQDSLIDESPRIRGDVLITNPSNETATVTVSVTLDDGTPVRIQECQGATRSGEQYSIPSLTQATCQYTASPRTQDATLSRAAVVLDVYEFSNETSLEWRSGTELSGVTLVDDANRRRGSQIVNDGGRWETNGTYTCPTEARVYDNNGMFFGDVVSTGILNEGSFELARASATATVTCYLPTISHTTTAGFEVLNLWDITAGVAPETEQAWAGETVEWTWDVGLTTRSVDEGRIVRGEIAVFNPHPLDELTVTIGAALDDRSEVTLECGNTLTVEAGMTGICAFTARPSNIVAERSIASLNFNRVNLYDEQPLVWAEEPIQIDRVVAVDDDHHEQGFPLFDLTTGGEWSYTTRYTCPLDPTVYEDGVFVYSKPNTAFVFTDEDILGVANARTTVTCLAPKISMTASASYILTWDWNMLTSSSADQLAIASNQTQPVSYLAMLSAESRPAEITVSGEITIENPHDVVLPLYSVVEQVASATYAQITCDSLDIEPESSLTCTYSATPPTPDDGTATASIGLASGVMTISSDYDFEMLEERDTCVTLQASNLPDETITRCASDDDLTYAYTLDFGAEGTENTELAIPCGSSTHENRITLITADSEQETVSDLAVQIELDCTLPEVTPEATAEATETDS